MLVRPSLHDVNAHLVFGSGLKGCEGLKDCLGAEGVLRVSLGCFVSFQY
jgi:hypothetical protein